MSRGIVRLSVRNLTGNARRTLLTLAAIAAGLSALIFLWAFNDGLRRNMLGNFQDRLVGSLQIHRNGFFANPRLGRHIADQRPILRALEQAGVHHWTRRDLRPGCLSRAPRWAAC